MRKPHMTEPDQDLHRYLQKLRDENAARRIRNQHLEADRNLDRATIRRLSSILIEHGIDPREGGAS